MDTQTQVQQQTWGERLERLGFSRAGAVVKEKTDRKRKLAVAGEHYRVLKQDKIDAFQKRLKAKTIKGKESYNATWQTLDFMPIQNYEAVPPKEVLDALEVAQDRKCFDAFEVAYIRNVKDPLLLGRVTGCPDRFFITQWDTDVRIEDILQANEG